MIGAKNMPDIAPDALVKRILQGDCSAEEELVNRYWRGVFLIISVRVRNRDSEEAHDLTQSTMMVSLQEIRAGKLRDHEKLSGFIHGIASNVIKNFLSKGVMTCELDEQVPGPDPVELLEAADRLRKLEEEISSFPSVDQEILLGVLESGESLEEIAKRLNIKPDTVRQRKLRAIEKLKKKFS